MNTTAPLLTPLDPDLAPVVSDADFPGLGRLCGDDGSGLAWGASRPEFARLTASFRGVAYDRHRHDTYALAITDAGVQTFWYRGAERQSLPGQVIVLHPDEIHTGAAGTDAGLRYRMLYLDPGRMLTAADDHGPLPFLADPVSADPGLRQTLQIALAELTTPPDPMLEEAIIDQLARHLHRLAGTRPARLSGTLDIARLAAARDYLIAHATEPVTVASAAALVGGDRFQLARQFRRRYGVSPYRVVIARRLTVARELIERGGSLADIAAASGFADQSHLSRQFKLAFGMTPGAWRAFTSGSTPHATARS